MWSMSTMVVTMLMGRGRNQLDGLCTIRHNCLVDGEQKVFYIYMVSLYGIIRWSILYVYLYRVIIYYGGNNALLQLYIVIRYIKYIVMNFVLVCYICMEQLITIYSTWYHNHWPYYICNDFLNMNMNMNVQMSYWPKVHLPINVWCVYIAHVLFYWKDKQLRNVLCVLAKSDHLNHPPSLWS